jgi:hypothetical protein
MRVNNLIKVSSLALTVLFSAASCKKEVDKDTMPSNTPTTTMQSMTYDYEFNNGQVVPTAAYDGMHSDDLTAQLKVEEDASGMAKITVMLNNTIPGETYHIHAHDAADPSTTPNGTPYNESPNGDILVQHVHATGTSVTVEQTAMISYDSIVNQYAGFLVVHDPLQAMSTTDISTYLVVGSFARTQTATNYKMQEFDYAFNTGQVAAQYAYNGTHATNLSGKLKLQELGNGETRVTVKLMNTMNNQTYNVHAHDKADPSTTPNGTPYNETPNANVLVIQIAGNGSTAWNNQISSMSYTDLTSTYEAFFVVHDPLQKMSTTDPTTYVLLGNFAR